MKYEVGVLQARAVSPAEGAGQRKDEEQRPRGATEAHQHSQMETTGGEEHVHIYVKDVQNLSFCETNPSTV